MENRITFTAEQKALMRRTVCAKCTDDQAALFIEEAEARGLNPFSRQLVPTLRWDSKTNAHVMSVITTIDAFRLIAERTGKYSGQKGPEWCGPDGEWREVWLDEKKPPAAARVGILRQDFDEPLWGTARFVSYAQYTKGQGGGQVVTRMWAKMPDVLIAKCAEALGFRRAFPQELSGLYTADEMGQASNPDPEPAAEPEPAAAVPVRTAAPATCAYGSGLVGRARKLANDLRLPIAERAELKKQYRESPQGLVELLTKRASEPAAAPSTGPATMPTVEPARTAPAAPRRRRYPW